MKCQVRFYKASPVDTLVVDEAGGRFAVIEGQLPPLAASYEETAPEERARLIRAWAVAQAPYWRPVAEATGDLVSRLALVH